MDNQPRLPGLPPVPLRPCRRRSAWEAELRRALTILADACARDAQRQEAALVRLTGQIEDLRHRRADLERVDGPADLHRAPVRRGELRRFAGTRP